MRETSPAQQRIEHKWNKIIAIILALIFPGGGQFYKRQVLNGLLVLIVTYIGLLTSTITVLLIYIVAVRDAQNPTSDIKHDKYARIATGVVLMFAILPGLLDSSSSRRTSVTPSTEVQTAPAPSVPSGNIYASVEGRRALVQRVNAADPTAKVKNDVAGAENEIIVFIFAPGATGVDEPLDPVSVTNLKNVGFKKARIITPTGTVREFPL